MFFNKFRKREEKVKINFTITDFDESVIISFGSIDVKLLVKNMREYTHYEYLVMIVHDEINVINNIFSIDFVFFKEFRLMIDSEFFTFSNLM